MAIAERLNMACSMIYRLWECAEHTHAMGVFNSPEIILQKKILGDHLFI